MSNTSPRPAVLYASAFPEILDNIVASCSRDTLIAFRQAGRQGLAAADPPLCKHVVHLEGDVFRRAMYRVKNTNILLQEYAEPKIYRYGQGAYAYPPIPDLEPHLPRPTPRVRDQRLRHVRIVDVPENGCLSGIRTTLLPNVRLVRVLPCPGRHTFGEIVAPDASVVHFYDPELEAIILPQGASGRFKRGVYNILYDPVLGLWQHRGLCLPWALRGARPVNCTWSSRRGTPHGTPPRMSGRGLYGVAGTRASWTSWCR